ncbi:MAG: carbamoyltransferase HypF [Pseudomonadota bacterium]
MPEGETDNQSAQRERIRVRGRVQGVGFRPFIWRLAARYGVAGDVRNDAEGVLIRAEGAALDAFAAAIRAEAPPLAAIEGVERAPLEAGPAFGGFSIVETVGGGAATRVAPDAATCADCLAEITDPAERRHRYAFANCTHCGPRFSIVERIPYDRAATTMRAFEMCADCCAEYRDPADRRFHAQPIACPVCGPRAWLERDGAEVAGDPIAEAARLLRDGAIVAIKGIGGFHLASDAGAEAVVAALRARKRRPGKPFALMAPVAQIRRYAALSPAEEAALRDPAAPVVLLAPRAMIADGAAPLAPSIAPGLDRVGWMAPYTPLHHLLLDAFGGPLVMTSGNLSGEPQAIEEEEARAKLAPFADAFLMHNRPIARRLDDSVARVERGELRLLRRARGFAPATLETPPGLTAAPPVLAAGGELKAALCLSKDGAALLTHHLGDLEDALSYEEYEKAAADYADLFDHQPAAIACDLHPDYRSTRFAEERAATLGLPLIRVQHHHAHIAACMAENGWPLDGAPVLGVALDGTGYGPDGSIWGGEILLCDYRAYRRVAHLAPAALPGGAAAVKEPWRCLLAQLAHAYPDANSADAALAGTPLAARLGGKPVAALRAMIAKGVNAPLSSSAGRLFDAVAAALDVAFDRQSYEGETGMRLEAMARGASADAGAYRFALEAGGAAKVIDPSPLWPALLEDLRAGLDAAIIARKFHEGLALGFAAALRPHLAASGAVAFSGGVCANAVLMERLVAALRAEAGASTPVLTHREAPASDGGLALGQAMIAAAQVN